MLRLHLRSPLCAFLASVILFQESALSLLEWEYLWGKCITNRRDKIHVTCPLGYVIYKPVFVLAAHAQHESESCRFSENDCHGEARDTSVQISKCFWENSCTLKWHEQMPIVKSSNASCVGVLPNYVAFNNPLCLPSDKIYNLCDLNDSIITDDYGVIRNLHYYKDRISDGPCLVTLRPRAGYTLSVTVQSVRQCQDGTLTLNHVSSNGRKVRLVCGAGRDAVIAVTSGEIVVELAVSSDAGSDEMDSAVAVMFEQKPFQHQTQELLSGNEARVISHFGKTWFDVRASISSCLPLTEESVTLTCPEGHAIFDPHVRMGSSGWDHRCSAVGGDCIGETPTSLVQRLQCFWRPTCRLSWQQGMPILKVTPERCLARQPNYFHLSGASCVPQDSVYSLCDKGSWGINATSVILRSHEDYPWNYETRPLVCRKRVRVHRKYGLRIVSSNMNLPPLVQNGDVLRLWEVSESNLRTLRRTYAGNDAFDETFKAGCVDLEFKKGTNSIRGQGFALKLETLFPIIGDVEPDFFDCGSLADAVRKQKQRRSKALKAKKGRRKNYITKSKGDQKRRASQKSAKRH